LNDVEKNVFIFIADKTTIPDAAAKIANALIDLVSSKKRKLVTIQQLNSEAGVLLEQPGLIEHLEKQEEQRKLKTTNTRNNCYSTKATASRKSSMHRIATYATLPPEFFPSDPSSTQALLSPNVCEEQSESALSPVLLISLPALILSAWFSNPRNANTRDYCSGCTKYFFESYHVEILLVEFR
jgi:hypothetical protein